MNAKSDLFASIRFADKKGKGKKAEPVAQICQWDGCEAKGTHKAPVGRMREGEYFHFCVDHVREYNKQFNYFSGLEDGDIAKFQKDAVTGHRPTWKTASNATTSSATHQSSPNFAQMRSGSAAYYSRVRDPQAKAAKPESIVPKARRAKPLEAKALETLGLSVNATSGMITTRYKELVKLHHPDANGGDRASEERFRGVLEAYRLLKKSGFC